MRVHCSLHLRSFANVFCRGNNLIHIRPRIGATYAACKYGCRPTFALSHEKRLDCQKGILSSKEHLSSSSPLQNPHSQQIYFSSTQSGENNNVSHKEEKLSLLQRFKQMYRDYWYVLVPVHVATSIVWFGGFYYIAKSGVDVAAILTSLGFGEKITSPFKDSSAGHLAVAYAMYKIATPARYTITLGGTTVSINYLKKWGYIKPIPPKEKLKEMYAEKKESMVGSYREKKESMVESYREKRESVKSGLQEAKQSISQGFRQGLVTKNESASKDLPECKHKSDTGMKK